MAQLPHPTTEQHETERGAKVMNRYEFAVPRARFAIAALAMSAFTFALAVIAPMQLASRDQETGVLAGAGVVKLAPIEVLLHPARLDTAGDCPQEAVVRRDDLVGLKSGQRG
jgi:hypothetical protein